MFHSTVFKNVSYCFCWQQFSLLCLPDVLKLFVHCFKDNYLSRERVIIGMRINKMISKGKML